MSGLACPCGSGTSFAQCCRPFLRGERKPDTAEQLMRSRYTAHVRRDPTYVLNTWHPQTRPAPEKLGDLSSPAWRGLDVTSTEAGGPADAEGVVTFSAHYEDGAGNPASLHETSTFVRLDGEWMYLEGRQFGG